MDDDKQAYSKVTLKTPIRFDPEKIQTEGFFITPNTDAEQRLGGGSDDYDSEENEDLEGFNTSDPGIPSCSSAPGNAGRKVSSLFQGLKLSDTKELEPILDGVSSVDEWSPLTPYSKLEKLFSNVTDHGEVKKKIASVGNGNKLPIHATVWVDYEMWGDGMDDVIFRTEPQRPFKFRFFQPDVMTWFDLGVSTMEELETAWFLVQPVVAYGKQGIARVIPPDTTLLFKIHVQKFQTGSVPGILRLPQEDLQRFKYREIVACVNELKEKACGYIHRSRPQWKLAYDLYRKATHFLEKYFVFDPELEMDMYKNIFNLHNNMALCAIKLEMYQRGIFHCQKALQLPEVAHSNLHKLFYRRAVAELETGHVEDALAFTTQAKKYALSNPDTQALEQRIRKQLKLNDEVQKDLFRKMMTAPSRGDKN